MVIQHVVTYGVGKSRFAVIHVEKYKLINNNERINTLFHTLRAVHLLLPSLVHSVIGNLPYVELVYFIFG